MSKKWTAERDQKLLLLMVEDVKIDYNRLAAKWPQNYPNEELQPTASAITQHIGVLKKQAQGAGGAGNAVGTPKSTTKRAAPKTPASSAKRTKLMRMSDDDDSESEMKDSPVTQRKTPSRRSKSAARKSYLEDNTDDDDDALNSAVKLERQEAGASASHSPAMGEKPEENSSRVDSVGNEGAQESKARSKKGPPKFASALDGEDSDESNFTLD